MKISYNWLKEYLSFDINAGEVAAALTSIGLETGSVEEIQTIKGGLEGLVIGEVLTCIKHPNSDHLHITTVNINTEEEPLRIVCGAPNVAEGQKVVVATIGTTLYDGDNEIKIKRCKIRGEESFGMICAEDEIGVGTDHSGIIVLAENTPVGLPAKDYYEVESDFLLEIDITPNRVDSTSHIGVARDLYAYLKQQGRQAVLKKPSVEPFTIEDHASAISVEIKNTEACLRYSGVTIKGVTVKESPDWLKNRLTSIGLRPINNIVDITNFVLHETGQPLHSFDVSKIKGNKIIVDSTPDGTKFITLDGVERTLTKRDLMICNAEEPMCIGGVFGGLDSGVTESSKDVFLESACFNPSWIRKTAHRFGLNTDSSFRFERGLDPNQTIYALKRAALLIKELAGGTITGEIQDQYPNKAEPFHVDITYHKINTLTGKVIPAETVKNILSSLEIEIAGETPEGLSLRVPFYRYDVRREVDVIEEILRIYGYNNIEICNNVHTTLSHQTLTDKSYKLENIISEQLCGAGFNEILNNSLTPSTFYEGLTTFPVSKCVVLKNPLSTDLNAMRQTLLFGGLQSIEFNIKHKNKNIRFFEFGNCYTLDNENCKKEDALSKFNENYNLGLWISGNRIENNWNHPDENSSIFELKAHAENILSRVGINIETLVWGHFSNDIYSSAMEVLSSSGRKLGTLGTIEPKILNLADIDNPVYFAELSWTDIVRETRNNHLFFEEISKFPEVKRDLALLVDKNISFEEIKKAAFFSERKRLKKVTLFDVYEGRNILSGKKSYAISFYLQDKEKTLNEKQINAIMSNIQKNIEDKTGAQLRS